jgi:glycosyltransferase involved in cell wall biosynthesis
MKLKVKRKILLFIDWYLPGYKAGGPIRSVANLIEKLCDEFDLKVVTCNSDLGDNIPYPNVIADSWQITDSGTSVYYFSNKNPSAKAIKKILLDEKPDVVYLNSMYSISFTLNPLRLTKQLFPKTKVVIAPRGMLSSGALLIKPFKKRLFLIFARSVSWFSNITWHASSETEKEEITNVFGKRADVMIARNLTKKKKIDVYRREKSVGEVKLLYIARISAVKNLLQSLQLLNLMKTKYEIIYDIYGQIDDSNYWELCKKEIKTLPGNIKVSIKGTVDNEKLSDIIKNYHFLFNLTHNENFGHSIVESLSEGCPVIISNNTPWKGLQKDSAGWDISLDDKEAVILALQTACKMNQHEYDQWSDGAYRLAGSIFNDTESEQKNRELFR